MPQSTRCSVDGCESSALVKGLCRSHYDRRRRRGDPAVDLLRVRGGRICEVEDCGQRASAHGMCPVHYQRSRRVGDTGGPLDRRHVRACDYCTAEFSSPDIRQKYCGAECAATAKSLRQAFRLYGITMQEYRAMWLRQDGKCAVCRLPERTERNRLLTIDHDHVTGHVRELLCSHCNRAIGLLQDDPKVIRAAAAYVERNRQLRLLI